MITFGNNVKVKVECPRCGKEFYVKRSELGIITTRVYDGAIVQNCDECNEKINKTK